MLRYRRTLIITVTLWVIVIGMGVAQAARVISDTWDGIQIAVAALAVCASIAWWTAAQRTRVDVAYDLGASSSIVPLPRDELTHAGLAPTIDLGERRARHARTS